MQPDVKEETCDVPKNVKLTQSLEAANNKVNKLEETLKRERDKVKLMDDELGNFRDDNLKIKKEKKDLKLRLEKQQNATKTSEGEIIKLIEKKARLEIVLRETCEALQSVNDEYKLLQDYIEQSKNQHETEIDSLKQKASEKHSKEVNTLISCQFCVEKFKSKTEFTHHVRIKHYRNQVSQTDEQIIEAQIK